ncbi:MAG: DUF5615 family PIN-like protein [Pyrinomonadaceae bacterium]
MRLLLDECIPRRLKKDFIGHEVLTIDEAGFKGLKNGNLLRQASGHFEVLITVDKNIEQQQNRSELPMAILILSANSNRYQSLSPLIPKALVELRILQLAKLLELRFRARGINWLKQSKNTVRIRSRF